MKEIELYNEDCQTILPEILTNLDRKKVIFVSDPPFNIGYHYNTYKDKMNKEQNANRQFVGIEIDKKYFEIAKERILNND